MKTSFDISEPLLRNVQRLAKSRGQTTRSLVEEALRHLVEQAAQQPGKPFVLRDGSFHGDGLSREFADASWDDVRAAAYGDRG